MFYQQPLHFEGYGDIAKVMLLVPVALTVIAFFVVRAMARNALALDDAEAASNAARAVALQAQLYSQVPPGAGAPPQMY